MPSWPLSLPEPVSRSLSVTPRENVLAYQADIGEPITRRRTTARLVDYSAQLFVTEAMRRELDLFHHDDCEDGSLSFTMTNWVGGEEATMKWTAPPQFNQAGPSGYWFANVSFVKLP